MELYKIFVSFHRLVYVHPSSIEWKLTYSFALKSNAGPHASEHLKGVKFLGNFPLSLHVAQVTVPPQGLSG